MCKSRNDEMADLKLIIDDTFREKIRKKVLEEAKKFNFSFEDEEELDFYCDDISVVETIIQSLVENKLVKSDVFEIR